MRIAKVFFLWFRLLPNLCRMLGILPTLRIVRKGVGEWASYRKLSKVSIRSANAAQLDKMAEVYALRRVPDETDDEFRSRLVATANMLCGKSGSV